MPDREKVIKGLECHADSTNLSCRPSKCPYFAFDFCGPLLATDALELLKEQEAVVRCKDCRWYDEKISFCDNCYLPREQTFFCADGKRRTNNA